MKPSSLLSFPPGTVAAAVIFLWIACAGSGCGPKNTPGVVSAEFLDDKYADGVPQAGERVRITLTGDLPTDFDPSRVRVFSGPPDRELQVQAVRVESLPDVLDLEFLLRLHFYRCQRIYRCRYNQRKSMKYATSAYSLSRLLDRK